MNHDIIEKQIKDIKILLIAYIILFIASVWVIGHQLRPISIFINNHTLYYEEVDTQE